MTTAGKVLVVDDDHAIRETLCAVLRDEGYDVLGARDGNEALEALHTTAPPPAAIVLDLMMPGMDGYEFRARQLADEAIKDIPVVVITAAGSGVRQQELGAPVMTKPFDLESLERKLHAMGV
jgi:CheY-like chemotaxis protein